MEVTKKQIISLLEKGKLVSKQLIHKIKNRTRTVVDLRKNKRTIFYNQINKITKITSKIKTKWEDRIIFLLEIKVVNKDCLVLKL